MSARAYSRCTEASYAHDGLALAWRPRFPSAARAQRRRLGALGTLMLEGIDPRRPDALARAARRVERDAATGSVRLLRVAVASLRLHGWPEGMPCPR